jgi:hypothetical protein
MELHGVTQAASSRWLPPLLEDSPCLRLLAPHSELFKFFIFQLLLSGHVPDLCHTLYELHICILECFDQLLCIILMMVQNILQVNDLIILISYDIIKFCKQKETKKYSYMFRYYFPRMWKQDKVVDRVSPRLVLACSLFFFLRSSISFFSNQTSRVRSCLMVSSWFLNSTFL